MALTRRSLCLGGTAAGLALAAPRAAFGQQAYPTRPIEMIVPWGPGGGADQTARKAVKLLEPMLNVSMPVVNVPGGTGVTGMTKMLAAPADGYTMQIVTADTTGLLAVARQRWGLDDIMPIAMMTQQRSGLFVREGGKFGSWRDVESAARRGEVKVAINGLGSPEELAINFFRKAGLQFTAVPFARPGERYAAVLGDHADLVYEQAGDIRSFIESKQLRPVLFLAKEPVSGFADVPVSTAVGLDLVLDQYRVMMIRAGTEPARVDLLASRLKTVAQSPEYRTYLDEQWADPGSYMGPAESAAFIRADIEALRKLA